LFSLILSFCRGCQISRWLHATTAQGQVCCFWHAHTCDGRDLPMSSRDSDFGGLETPTFLLLREPARCHVHDVAGVEALTQAICRRPRHAHVHHALDLALQLLNVLAETHLIGPLAEVVELAHRVNIGHPQLLLGVHPCHLSHRLVVMGSELVCEADRIRPWRKGLVVEQS